MKVFNKEVSCCNDCPMIDRNSDRYLDPKCNLSHGANVSDKNKTISKDCPFNKPTTKEVIEGFVRKYSNGFNTIFKFVEDAGSWEEDVYQTYWIEEEEFLDEEYIYFKPKTNEIKITHKSKNLFIGVINNPVELEFILKSIGVIE